jgi:hypothetical protein
MVVVTGHHDAAGHDGDLEVAHGIIALWAWFLTISKRRGWPSRRLCPGAGPSQERAGNRRFKPQAGSKGCLFPTRSPH